MKRNEAVIGAQITRLNEALKALLPPGTPYALIDFPDHANVGDSAIWMGEIRLLRRLTGRSPSYVCTTDNFDVQALRAACPTGPLLLHGGGNLGDIWPRHQLLRETVIETFRARRIIQLPQSIKFRNEKAMARCVAAIAAHPDVHVLVRDEQSLAVARRHFDCPSELAPDSAFALGPLRKAGTRDHKLLLLMRTDEEEATMDKSPLAMLTDAVIVDWLDEPARFKDQARRRALLKTGLAGKWSAQNRRLAIYQQLAAGRVTRGLKLLSSGTNVITDRLHAHILSVLLDIPHVALDNDYGKVSSYIKAWTHEYPAVAMAATPAEALRTIGMMDLR